MFRLPHDKRSRIQLTIVVAFILTFYFGVRYVANWIEGGHDFLELQDAIARGNLEEIERALNASASPNVRSPDGGKTALHVAVEKDNKEVVEFLLDHGADPNAKDEWGRTPLQIAAYNSAETTGLLLANGADPDVVDQRDSSPLHAAAYNGNIDTVRLLVSHGVALHGRSNNDWPPQQGTPAVIALRFGYSEIASYILYEAGKGDLSEENLDTLLDGAALSGDVALINKFVEAGGDPNAEDVRRYWGPNGSVYASPIHSAVMGGSVEAVRTLIELGAALPTYQGFYETNLLSMTTNAESITLLIQQGIDVNYANELGETALHLIAQHDAIDAVIALIEGGANINARTDYGESPIAYAVDSLNVNMLKLLLEKGADPSSASHDGTAPQALARQAVTSLEQRGVPTAGTKEIAVLELIETYIAKLNATHDKPNLEEVN